jgi:hypothetical protein
MVSVGRGRVVRHLEKKVFAMVIFSNLKSEMDNVYGNRYWRKEATMFREAVAEGRYGAASEVLGRMMFTSFESDYSSNIYKNIRTLQANLPESEVKTLLNKYLDAFGADSQFAKNVATMIVNKEGLQDAEKYFAKKYAEDETAQTQEHLSQIEALLIETLRARFTARSKAAS